MNEAGNLFAATSKNQTTNSSVAYQDSNIVITRETKLADDSNWPCAQEFKCLWMPLDDSATDELLARPSVSQVSAGSSAIFGSEKWTQGQKNQKRYFLKIEFPASVILRNHCDEVTAGQQCRRRATNAIFQKQRTVKLRTSFATNKMTAVLLEMPPHSWIKVRAFSRNTVITALGDWRTKVEMGMRLVDGSLGQGARLLESGDVLGPQSMNTELYNLGEKPARLLVFIYR